MGRARFAPLFAFAALVITAACSSDNGSSGSGGSPAVGGTSGTGASSGTGGTGGSTGCPSGLTSCSGQCVDVKLDPANCGSCGKACASGQVCSSSACGVNCGGGTTLCGSACADTNNDPANCGSCGNVCAVGELCAAGQCGVSCSGGTTLCGQVCANLQNDPANCGTCGTACSAGQVCSAGQCGVTCVGGTTLCGATCVQTDTDPNNCGACGTTCASGQVCSSGACGVSCGGGTTLCASLCTNTDTDPNNCGQCGTVCSTGQVCSAGACGLVCSGGTTKCGNLCTDTNTDPANCGACGTVCTTGQVCQSGSCVLQCSGGTTKCGNLCTNTQTDPSNCGACGVGDVCTGGVCAPTSISVGMIGYWKFDETSGTVAHDSSGNNLSGTVQNGAAWITSGKQGGALLFDGLAGDVRITFPNNAIGQGAVNQPYIPQGKISFAMWFKKTVPSTAMQGLMFIQGVTWGSGCDRVVGNGTNDGTLQYNAWSEVNMQGVAKVNDGNWHHIAYVLDQGNALLAYVDGVLDVSSTTATTNCGKGCSGFNWASDLVIAQGGNCRFGANGFGGTIDEVRLYNRALTAVEVGVLYNVTK
jgi:hypothetical protein